MGFRIEAPKQDGNARFDTLKVNLNENNSATRTVVSDEEGNFYYGAGGGGGTAGTNGTSGANGTSGTSGTGFNTISNPQLGRVLLSDGSTNSAIAATNLNFLNNTLQVTGSLIADTLLINSDVFEFTGSLRVLGGITGSLLGTSSWAINALTSSFVTASNVYGPYGSNSIISASNAATASSADTFVIRSDVFEFTGSVRVLGSITGSLLGTSSFAITASHALNAPVTASHALVASSSVVTDTTTGTGPYYVTFVDGTSGNRPLRVDSNTLTFNATTNVLTATASQALTASSADTFFIRSDVFEFTGSIRVQGGITGSLLGTASFATTASHALNVPVTASHALVASSSVVTDTTSGTGPFYLTFVDGTTGNRPLRVDSNTLTFNATTNILTATASFAISSSYALSSSFAISSSRAITSSHALTASSADNFFVRQNITASNALINNTLTAQTLVVQTITSSIIYSSGSNIFGNQLTNIQQFTGSLRVSGSLNHYIVGANVGINTINPSAPLHVSGAGIFSGTEDQILTLNSTDSSWAYIGYSWAGTRRFYTGLDSSGKYAFGSDGGAVFYFTGASLGVGNTSPSTLLTVGNTSGDNGGITVLADNTSDTYDVFSGQRKYPRISLIDSFSGGSTFQIWNLGNELRFGTTAGSSTISAFNVNAGETGSVIFNGSVGIKTPTPFYALDVLGTIRATGDVIAFSDARVKDNVETITGALSKVKSLRGVSYTRNDSEDKSLKIGIIAQEVLKVLPEVVQQDDHGKYSVAYGNMVGLLIEAIKEQQQQIEELKYLLKNN